MSDPFANKSGLTAPATGIAAVTPDDNTDLPSIPRAIHVGVAGDLAVVMLDGSTGTLPALAAGIAHAYRVKRVLATGTTAANIWAVY